MECEILLKRYAEHCDAEAFRELVRRYADMVYTTSLRITGNSHDAEDAAQECFLALARNAGSVRTNLLGWLHATARNASLAVVKRSRKRKEGRTAMARANNNQADPTWKDLEPHIDAAIQDLPEDLQPYVMLYYLQDKTQSEIARIMQVDQSTVSRRLEKGVAALRGRLQKAGLVISTAALMTLLGQSTLQAAPPVLTAALGKIALAGLGEAAGAAASSTAATSFLGTLGGKIVAGVALGAIAVGGALLTHRQLVKTRPQNAVKKPIVRELPRPEPTPIAAPPAKEPKVPKEFPEVLLGDVVKEFNDLIGRLNEGHVVGAGDEVYQQPSVYLSFHVIQMRAEGWKKMDFDTVAVVSGSSALFAYDPKSLMPKYANLHIGMDRRIAEATGFAYEWLDFTGAEQAWDLIRDNIDDGHSLKGWYWENVLFAGYHDADEPENRKVFVCADGPGTYAKWWTWEEFTKWHRTVRGWKQTRLGRLANRANAADAKTVALRVMRDLVDWSETPPDVVKKQYAKAKFGLAAIEAFAADVADVTKKPKEYFKETAWCACHASNPQWIVRNSTGVYLERVAAANTFDAKVNGHLLAAAKDYRAAYTNWQEFYNQLGHKAPKNAWDDAARRAAGAAAVRKALEHEKTAIAEVSKALPEASRKVVEGVPDGKFGIQWDMLVRAMQTLLESRGVKASYNELLAYSGDAFNLCHGSNWQGVAYLCTPTDPTANLARAYGFEYACTSDGYTGPMLNNRTRDERLVLAHKALGRMYAEIDAGRPVLLAGAEEHCGSVTLVVGYDRTNGKLCHVGDAKPYRWTAIRGVTPGAIDEKFGIIDGRIRGTVRKGFAGGWQANPAYLIGKSIAAPNQREKVVAALRRAVELHRAPKHTIGWWGGVDYYFGERAYEEWARELHDLDYPADLKKKLPKDAYDWYEMGNMDTQVDQVVKGRTAAAEFCEKSVDVLPKGKTHLLAAAKLYREEVAIARETFSVFQPPWDGNDAPRVAWLSDETKREVGARAIGKMLEKERAAIREIEKALAALE